MLFDEHSVHDLIKSLEAEVAKASNEIIHAQNDLEKAMNRQKFILAIIHHLKTRI